MANTNKVNEDNWSGFHGQKTLPIGINEAPTTIDAPSGIELFNFTPNPTAGGYVHGRPGNVSCILNLFSNNFSNNTKTINNVAGAAAGAAGSGASSVAGLAWFATAFKTMAIVAAGSAIIAGLVKLLKIANKEIKVRYNKVVKTLQRAQRDFVLNENGMDMRTLMPGLGTKIGDFFSKLFAMSFLFGKNKSINNSKYNLGLHPFCNRYKDEIAMDYKTAIDAFNKIPMANSQVSAETKQRESYTVQYNSFREAFMNKALNESYVINESENGIILEASALAGLRAVAGAFRFNNSNDDGTPDNFGSTEVKVTKESVREICYSIIYGYLDKYVNMEGVFKQLGIDSKSLSDLDKSSCDKLKTFLEKYQKPDSNNYNKQYSRVKKAFDTMLGHYYKIGYGIIDNFKKYTEAKDEKHANLLVAGEQKLRGMWDAQKDILDNNFSHVLIEIISSDVYMGYLNFIIENVLPVFKTGLAGDADYVLDILPRKGQYYLIRQTEGEPTTDDVVLKGNVAIAEVISFDEKKKQIKFKIRGLVEKGEGIDIDSATNIATLGKNAKVNNSAFLNDKGEYREVQLPYNKWMSLDPLVLNWTPDENTDSYFKEVEVVADSKSGKKKKGYIVIRGVKGTEGKFIWIGMSYVVGSDIRFYKLKIGKAFNNATFVKQMQNMEFKDVAGSNNAKIESVITKISIEVKQDTQSTEINIDSITNVDPDKIIESTKKEEMSDSNIMSPLYKREFSENNQKYTEYFIGYVSRDTESVDNNTDKERLYDGINEADDNKDSKTKIVNPNDEGADKDLVSKVRYARYNDGKYLLVVDFKLQNACSVKKLDEILLGVKCEKVDKDDAIDVIVKQKNTKEQKEIPSVDNLNDEANVYSEGKDQEANNIFKEIKQKMEGDLGIGDKKIKEDFEKTEIEAGVDKKYSTTAIALKNSDNGYDPKTGIIVNEKGNHPTKVLFVALPNTKENSGDPFSLGMIISIGNLKKTVDYGKEGDGGVTNAVDDLINAVNKNEASLDDKLWNEIPKAIEVFEKIKNGNGGGNEKFEFTKELKDDYDSVYKNLKIENGKFQDLNRVESNDRRIRFVPKNDTEFDIYYQFSKDDALTAFGKISSDGAVLKNGLTNELINVNLNDAEDVYNVLLKIYKAEKNIKDSLTISYSVNKAVSESASSVVTINRKFDRYLHNWYVLSESVYDDGSMVSPKIDSPYKRSRMKTRDDVMGFVKSTDNASIMKFDSDQSYTVESVMGYVPGVATPLYESIMLVKFDEDDSITEKIYLGKYRIK